MESGSVRNADRKCKAKTNFAACGQNLGVYTAKPNLPGLGTETVAVSKIDTYGAVGMQVVNVKHSHCEAKLGLRVWAKFGCVHRDALRIWACTPQKPHLLGLVVKIRSKNGQLNGSAKVGV